MDEKTLIRAALREDLNGRGDVTTKLFVPPDARFRGRIRARQAGVVCGARLARDVFKACDPRCRVRILVADGGRVRPGQAVLEISGGRGVLTAERTALNFLQRLSGIATLTAAFAAQARGTRARILDTRKTIPGWRALEKYAVRCGGGVNHRMGLYDAVMVKDNHWLRPQAFAAAVRRLRRLHPRMSLIMEADEMTQVRRALELGADVVMLDNMPPPRLRQAIAFIRKSSRATQIEVSGRVDIKSVRALARLGPDRISIGRITHSAPALDVGLDLA
ncbi:MAG TPA: carboxylating nicotinate-nucleotide diphosphorylase [Elusimicrobia bacterium]|nr:carboxylating nicotinate-nucleotide diphosphorylase [Elusimicrobiota bacterium]HBT60461.1 carboxylating nicotinate-nucleotide diphosphorylase [Elusimicrobiota bacterium]